MKNHVATAIIALGTILLITSCTHIYKFIGLTDQQTANQTAKDQAVTIHVIDTAREQLWQIITAAVTATGGLASGLLARWLGTEKKITAALITGIEAARPDHVKESVTAKATSAGVESKLNARVRALT